MRQRELLEFRTPQHPSLGTNNWGGSSPMLARNIPKEALDQRYLLLNTVRECDQIFHSTTIQDEIFRCPPPATIGDKVFFSSSNVSCRKGFLWKFKWRRRPTFGLNSGFTWFPKWNAKNRWPNGW